jgi:hypothetical protein
MGRGVSHDYGTKDRLLVFPWSEWEAKFAAIASLGQRLGHAEKSKRKTQPFLFAFLQQLCGPPPIGIPSNTKVETGSIILR